MKKNFSNIINICFVPILFVLILWAIKGFEILMETNYVNYGLIAKSQNHFINIITYPFIHSGDMSNSIVSYKDFEHLINNSLPLILLGSIIAGIYKDISNKIFLWSYLMSGCILWIIGNPNENVIGASGIVYALASFIVISGFIRGQPRLAMLSFLIIFIYGNSIFCGMIPMPNDVSWEGHLSGFIAGTILAIIFRRKGPKPKKYLWELEEEMEKKSNQEF